MFAAPVGVGAIISPMPMRWRTLPWQNMIVIAAIFFGGEWLVTFLLPWPQKARPLSAALWTLMLPLARLAAKLILRPARASKRYGFWMIALAATLAALAQLFVAAEPAPGLRAREVLVRFVSTVVLLLIAAPWFIRKETFSTLSSS